MIESCTLSDRNLGLNFLTQPYKYNFSQSIRVLLRLGAYLCCVSPKIFDKL